MRRMSPRSASRLIGLVATAWVAMLIAGLAVALSIAALGGILVIALGLCALVASVWLASPRRMLAELAPRPAEPERDARLVNLAEGLGVASGISRLGLAVLEDPALNAIVLWRRSGAVLVCTSGLLGALDRIELEGVVAHEIAVLRSGDARAGSIAAIECALLAAISSRAGQVVARLAGLQRAGLADLAASRLTRYPPGLAGALTKLAAARTRPETMSPMLARLSGALWLAPLDEAFSTTVRPGMLGLADRAAALAEL